MHVFALHTCIHTCPSARDVLAKGKIEKARHRVDLGLDVVEEAFTVDLYKSLHCQCCACGFQSLSFDSAQFLRSYTREPTVQVAIPYGFLQTMSSGSLPSPPANDSSPARSHFEGRAGLSRLYTDTDACVLAHTRTRALSLSLSHTHTHVRMPRFCMHLLRCAAPPTYRHKHTHLWENILDVFKTQLVRFVRHVACSRIGKFALLLHTYHHPCAGAPKCKSTNAPRSAKAQMQKHKTTCAHVA